MPLNNPNSIIDFRECQAKIYYLTMLPSLISCKIQAGMIALPLGAVSYRFNFVK